MKKIRNYIDELFQDVSNSKKARELKEEIIADLEDKYEDLVRDGKEAKEAYNAVVAGIGDIDELLAGLREKEEDRFFTAYEYKRRRRKAWVVSISVALYILSLVAIAVLEETGAPEFASISAFFVLIGLATCLLIFHSISMPKYSKSDNTMIEEFKEWKQVKTHHTEIRRGLDSIVWTLTVIVYFVISFLFNIWYISWIVFLIGALVVQIVHLVLQIKGSSHE